MPFCKHACPYCDFYKMELRDRPARTRLDFPAQVAAEATLLLAAHPELAGRPLETIYFGGGTPSTLVPSAVATLIAELSAPFQRVEDCEVTLEANPENLVPARARAWAAAGINRLSIGVQSFHRDDLVRLERLHEPATIPRAVANARAAGIANLSLDLMFALPGQTLAAWLDNLQRAVDLAPQHLSFYGLTYHEGTPFESARSRGQLSEADEDLQAEMYLAGAELLERAGFEHYEISNFALPGYRSRHNQRYWTRADVLGLGPGAHSNLAALRWANPDDLDGWAAAIAAGRMPRADVENPSPALLRAERVYTALRRREGMPRADDQILHAAATEWLQNAGATGRRWLRVEKDHVALTREGWLLADRLVEELTR